MRASFADFVRLGEHTFYSKPSQWQVAPTSSDFILPDDGAATLF